MPRSTSTWVPTRLIGVWCHRRPHSSSGIWPRPACVGGRRHARMGESTSSRLMSDCAASSWGSAGFARTGEPGGTTFSVWGSRFCTSCSTSAPSRDLRPAHCRGDEMGALMDEFSGVTLGDARLEARAVRIAGRLEESPSESFPDQMQDDADNPPIRWARRGAAASRERECPQPARFPRWPPLSPVLEPRPRATRAVQGKRWLFGLFPEDRLDGALCAGSVHRLVFACAGDAGSDPTGELGGDAESVAVSAAR